MSGHLLGLGTQPACLLCAAAFLLFLAASISRKMKSLEDPALLVLVACASCFQCAVNMRSLRFLPPEFLEAEKVSLSCQVLSDPVEMPGGVEFRARADSACVEGSRISVKGIVSVRARLEGQRPAVGERWLLSGAVREPRRVRNPGGFDARAALAREGVGYVLDCGENGTRQSGRSDRKSMRLTGFVSDLRRRISEVFEESIGGSEGPLLRGLLLGERTGMGRDIMQMFKESGVIHVLAVSGLNVGIISFILCAVLRTLWMPKRLVTAVSSLLLVFYCLLAGTKPPVVRATIMFTCFSCASLLGRELDPLNALCVAALLILAHNPFSAFDAGFQLSFACTFSIIWIPGLTRFSSGPASSGWKALLGWVGAAAAVSVSAQLGSIPLLLHHFQTVSVISIAANMIVVPLTTAAIWFGMLVAAFGLLKVPLLGLAASADWFLLKLTLVSVRLFSSVPFAFLNMGPPPLVWIALWYAVLSFLPRMGTSRRARVGCLLALLVTLNIQVWDLALRRPAPLLSVAFLDVGQGDCAVLRTGSGEVILVDSGPKYGEWDAGEWVVAPFLRQSGVKRIDLVVLSHPHDDHLGGLGFVLEHFQVERVMDSGIPFASKTYLDFLRTVRDRGIRYTPARKGTLVRLGTCSIRALYPDEETAELRGSHPGSDPNDISVVLSVACGRTLLVFPGDIHDSATRVFESLERIDVLKAPHHGSERPNKSILDLGLAPSFAVISCGADNRFGLPSEGAVFDYVSRGSRVLRTDGDGCVLVEVRETGCEAVTMREICSMSPLSRFAARLRRLR